MAPVTSRIASTSSRKPATSPASQASLGTTAQCLFGATVDATSAADVGDEGHRAIDQQLQQTSLLDQALDCRLRITVEGDAWFVGALVAWTKFTEKVTGRPMAVRLTRPATTEVANHI